MPNPVEPEKVVVGKCTPNGGCGSAASEIAPNTINETDPKIRGKYRASWESYPVKFKKNFRRKVNNFGLCESISLCLKRVSLWVKLGSATQKETISSNHKSSKCIWYNIVVIPIHTKKR